MVLAGARRPPGARPTPMASAAARARSPACSPRGQPASPGLIRFVTRTPAATPRRQRSSLTHSARHSTAAEAALDTVAVIAEQAPRFAGWSLAAAQAMLDGPVEVAIVGAPTVERDALERQARRHPGAVVVVADRPDDRIPLLVGRDAVDGRPAAYVCRGFVCERPMTTVDELTEALLR